jgi:hypothetical protein
LLFVDKTDFICFNSVLYIDMEGRSDDQSMRIMIEQMAPKRIAFVHGNAKKAKLFSNALSTSITSFFTERNQTISMKSDTKTYSIKMDDTLLHSLKMKKVNDYEICRFSGIMRYPESEEEKEEDNDGDTNFKIKDVEKRMLLYPMSMDEKAAVQGNGVTLIEGRNDDSGDDNGNKKSNMSEDKDEGMWMGEGELKLSFVRGHLQRAGIRAEFQQGGVLVCEGDIAISKSGQNNFSLEGVVGDRYYKIRDVLYQLLTYIQ